MKMYSISGWLLRFLYHQLTYLMTATAVVAIFWAITGQGPSLAATLIYTFILGNLTAFALENVKMPCAWRAGRWSPLLYLALLLVVIPVAVIVATAIVFVAVPPLSLPPAPRSSFWAFLATGWKFPTVASMIFGGGYLAYVAKRNRLEDRNRQLQQAIDSEIAERELDAAELQQARDIQRGLLPKEIPQLPEFEITGVWEPARVVGGDYYDVIQLSKEKLAICIADVVGKGISAALLMANIQAAVRAFASETASPAEVCSRVNSVICTNIASGKFVTMFYGVLDSSTKTLSFTNAGHLRPILISDNGRIHHLENDGALLGVFPHWKYEDSSVELRPGDLLMLFTDGITEAMSSDGTEFGEESLVTAAIGAPEETLDELQSQIVAQVKSFCHGRLTDDATLVLVAAPRAGADEKNLALGRSNASEQFIYAGVNS